MMDRHSKKQNNVTGADALLQKLQKNLLQNADDMEAIAAEEAAVKRAGTRRYRYRVTKRADYLEKKRIAETLAMAADEADISDEDLEALLRSYLKETPRAKPVIENTAEMIPVTPNNEHAEQTVRNFDLDQPLSKTEEPFFEELEAGDAIPTEVVSDGGILSDALFDDNLLGGLTEDDLITDIDMAAAEETVIADETEAPGESDDEIAPDDALAAFLSDDPLEDTATDSAADEFADAINVIDAIDMIDSITDAPGDGALPSGETEIDADVPQADSEDADDDLMALLASMDDGEDTFFGAFDDDSNTDEAAAVPEATVSGTEPDEAESEPVSSRMDYDAHTAISNESLEQILASIENEEADFSADAIALFGETEETVHVNAADTDSGDSDVNVSAEDPLTDNDGIFSDEEIASVLSDIPDDMLPMSATDIPEDNLADEAFPMEDLLAALPTEEAAVSEAAVDSASDNAEAADMPETEIPLDNADPAQPADGEDAFDQTDLDLMIAFGMEDQIEKAVGKERAKKYQKAIGERGENHYNEMHMGDRPDTVFDKHAEYVSSAQNREIFAEYKKKYSGMLFRFLGALFFLILLFFFENDKLLGLKLPALFDREQYPLVYTLFDLQLVVLSGAMVWRGIRTGIRAIFRGRPVPESITGFLFIACTVYTAVIASLCPMRGLQLYNFPIALAVLFELCYEFMNLRREIMSFKIVSSKKLKYAVDAISPKDGEAERRMFAEYISDDPALFRIKRTNFVENFFARSETYPRTQRILRAVIPAVFLLTLAFFSSAFMLSGSVYDALTAAYISLLLTLPSCAFIMFSYPMYRASGFAYEKESAMIGEASLGEYADASVVTFDDKEVFPSRGVHVRNVKVYGNNRIDHVIFAAASVFKVVGGPLSDVFETATGELGYSENVKLIRLDRDGIESRVDGDTTLIGRAAFVNRYGYNVTLSESENAMEETGDACILYVAYRNNIAAKLYIQYAVEPDFEVVLKQLYRQGICVGIKTSDPNIDDHLLSCKIKMSKYPVKIIKCAEPKETAIIVDRLSSGIVSKSSAKSLLQTLAICDRVLSASRTNNVLGIVSILLAMAAMAFFIISGMSITVAPLFIALYQLFWVIPVIAVARYYI